MNSVQTSEKAATNRKGSRWLLSPGYRPSGVWISRPALSSSS
jgi:hypothetical protein